MFKSVFLAAGFFLLWLGVPAWGLEPIARVSGPATVSLNHEVILSFTGTISEGEPEYDVALAPEGSSPQIIPLYSREQNLTYGIVVPDKPGLYRFVVVASVSDPDHKGQSKRKYAFLDVNVQDQIGPLPGPPPPCPDKPVPTPTPEFSEVYGFYTFSRQLMALMPNTPTKVQAVSVSQVFASMAAKAGSYTSAQQFVTDTSNSYKSLLGPNYPFWAQYYFGPLKAKLSALSTSGQLPQDLSTQVQVWREISAALKEVR